MVKKIAYVKSLLLVFITATMLILSGCSGMDINSAIKALPQVKTYLDNNPDFDLQFVYYSEDEVSALSNEFQANCGKELTLKPIYRFVIDDKKSVSGVGYFDLNNGVLECFKKVEGTTISVEGENVDETQVMTDAIVVDNVLVSSDGSVKVGNNVAVSADGSVVVGGITVQAQNVVKVNEDIIVDSNGGVKVGNIQVSGNGAVNVGDISVDENGNVKVGNGVSVGQNGNVDVNVGDVNVNVHNYENAEDYQNVDVYTEEAVIEDGNIYTEDVVVEDGMVQTEGITVDIDY